MVVRLSEEQVRNYEFVKKSLQRKYKLPPESFSLKFRTMTKKRDETFSVCLQLAGELNEVVER